MSSLQTRISVGVVGIASGVVLLASIGIWSATRAVLVRGVDRDLINRSEWVQRFERGFSGMPRRQRPPPPPPPDAKPEASENRRMLQIVEADTLEELTRSPSLAAGTSLATRATASAPPAQPYSQTLEDGTRVRVLAVRMVPGPPQERRRVVTLVTPGAPGVATAGAGDGTAAGPPASSTSAAPPSAAPVPTPSTGAAGGDGPAPSATGGPAAPAPPASAAPASSEPGAAPSTPAASGGQPEPGAAPSAAERPPGPGASGVRVAYIAIDLGPVSSELWRMAVVLAVLWGTATLMAWGAVRLLRSTILRPVRDLSAAIDRLGPDDLSTRVPDGAGPDEVRGIVQRLNSLLDRLEEAFTREQATIANIAHELRTPVSVLRTTIEFRMMAASAREELEVLGTCLLTVEQMQAVVSNLLLLARLEAGKEPLTRAATDVGAVLGETIGAWSGRAEALGHRIAAGLPEGLAVDTSSVHLRVVLDNLLGNAIAHSPPGSAIAVRLDAGPGGVRAVIENPVAAPLDAAQLGNAFYRGDQARSRSEHCGLGLVLCRRLARLLDSDLALSADGGRFRAALTLPVGLQAAPVAR